MKTSSIALERLKRFEGFSHKAYPDTGGVWTIGYGYTRGVKPGMFVTKERALELFLKNVAVFEECINNAVLVELTQNQFDALVSLTYNIGVQAFKTSTLLKILNTGDYKSVPAQIKRWNKDNGKVIAGLVSRRAEEAKLFETN